MGMSFDLRNSRLALAGGLLLLVGGAFGAGCSSDPQQSYPFPDVQSYCEALATVQCNANVVAACYGSDQASLSTDTQSCVNVRSSKGSCNPSNLPYNPAAAQACLDQQDQAWNDAQLSADEVKAIEDACIGVFNGGKGEGVACTANTDCDTDIGLRCIIKEGESGTCQKPNLVSAGNKCTDVADQCESGFHCDDGGHCVSNPEIGDACGPALPCNENAFCSDGTCVSRKNNGSTCLKAEECSGGFCLAKAGGSDGICSSTFKLEITSENCEDFR
jgi:hypothetical protein